LDERLLDDCLHLPLRQCQQKGIGRTTWEHIRATGEVPTDRRGRPQNLLLTQAILDFVSQKPYLSTDVVAMALGCSRDKGTAVFREHKLNFFWQRLRFAGIDLKELDPDLVKARGNSLHVDGPGALVHMDAKRYGALEGGKLIVGITIVDNYSSFAHLFLCPDGHKFMEHSVEALNEFRFLFPAPISKLYTDNGSEFKNSAVLGWCESLCIKYRNTQVKHAWSNGKVERCQSMLKREVVIPALCEAKFSSISELADDIDHRMQWWNDRRINGGKINRGLPPRLVVEATAGLLNDEDREEALALTRAEWQTNARSQWQKGATK